MNDKYVIGHLYTMRKPCPVCGGPVRIAKGCKDEYIYYTQRKNKGMIYFCSHKCWKQGRQEAKQRNGWRTSPLTHEDEIEICRDYLIRGMRDKEIIKKWHIGTLRLASIKEKVTTREVFR